MSGKVFVDTNVLIYAYDLDAGNKHKIAADRVKFLWETEAGMLSTQVLQEFYVNVTQKIPIPIPLAKVRGIISAYSVWQMVLNSLETILHASEIQARYQLSFWDAMIMAAASEGRAEKVLTEDLNHGQLIEGVMIENPFLVETQSDI